MGKDTLHEEGEEPGQRSEEGAGLPVDEEVVKALRACAPHTARAAYSRLARSSEKHSRLFLSLIRANFAP